MAKLYYTIFEDFEKGTMEYHVSSDPQEVEEGRCMSRRASTSNPHIGTFIMRWMDDARIHDAEFVVYRPTGQGFGEFNLRQAAAAEAQGKFIEAHKHLGFARASTIGAKKRERIKEKMNLVLAQIE